MAEETYPRPTARTTTSTRLGRFVLGTSAALMVYNNLVGIWIPPAWYVPVNLLATCVLVATGVRAGLGSADFGFERGHLSSGLKLGAAVAGLGGVALVAALAIPALRPALEDERVAGIRFGLLVYRALVRIPLGTVILEELAFRGVLLGAWVRWRGTVSAVVGSSVMFGLWHFRPTLDLLANNDLVGPGPGRAVFAAAAVLGTTLAGAVFAILRLRTRSLMAALVAHAGINSLAIGAAFIAFQLA